MKEKAHDSHSMQDVSPVQPSTPERYCPTYQYYQFNYLPVALLVLDRTDCRREQFILTSSTACLENVMLNALCYDLHFDPFLNATICEIEHSYKFTFTYAFALSARLSFSKVKSFLTHPKNAQSYLY